MIAEKGVIARLKTEHEQLKRCSEMCNKISFIVTENVPNTDTPCAYELVFKVKTFIGIYPDHSPMFGYSHGVCLDISDNYPYKKPFFQMMTPVWHPNILCHGPRKGSIDFNAERIDTALSCLASLHHMLTYRDYYAEIDSYPYPEDLDVAKWVKDYGEPMGFIDELRNSEPLNYFK